MKRPKPTVPLSEDPRMDRLVELLGNMAPDRQAVFLDRLNRADNTPNHMGVTDEKEQDYGNES